jgi:hypothetical protein
MLAVVFNSLPVLLLVEGGLFATLAFGVRLSRRVQDRRGAEVAIRDGMDEEQATA